MRKTVRDVLAEAHLKEPRLLGPIHGVGAGQINLIEPRVALT